MVHRGELIPAYLDGDLTGEEKQRLEEHLAVCAQCGDELTALEEVGLLLSEAPLFSPQPGFTARVMARLAQREARRRGVRSLAEVHANEHHLGSGLLLPLGRDSGGSTPWAPFALLLSDVGVDDGLG